MRISVLLALFLITSTTGGQSKQYDQYGTDGQCYTVTTRTSPYLHKLEKTITLCGGNKILTDVTKYLMAPGNYSCPDNKVEVLSFAPNAYPIEVDSARTVYNASLSLGFNSVLLLGENATSANFLSYARCPQLQALFYDGDADPECITTYDGMVCYGDIARLSWNYQVVTYWLACQAYKNPMLAAVTEAKPRRWAAGISDLLIGPSDTAATVAMVAALRGGALEETFNEALKQYDNPDDIWGFGGFGAD